MYIMVAAVSAKNDIEGFVMFHFALSNTLKLSDVLHHFNSWRNDSVSVCPLLNRDHVHSEALAATI